MDDVEQIISIEALKNSIKYGKADSKAVLSKIMASKPELRSKANEIKTLINSIVEKINTMDLETRKTELLKLEPTALSEEKKAAPEQKTLPDLPNAKVGDKKNPVVMRMAPYPSGALHIGNARMIVLNDEYVKRYKGKLILCFDDTIGTTADAIESDKESAKFVIPEGYDLILEGLEYLEVKYDKKNIKYKSDRVDIYIKYASDFIKQGYAYVCTCNANDFREKYKIPGIECPCRSKSLEEHLERWNKMLDGTYGEGEAVVRLKTGMDQKDPAVRDHIIMRISDAEHPRIGKKTRVWPLLDFSWGIDDHEFGVTHIIRGADLRKEGFIEEFIWDLMKWPKPEILLYGRLKFSDEFRLSKTEARVKIQNGEYDGWEDPRTWTIQSLKARGIEAKAIREALLDLGMSLSGINFSEKWLYAKNTKLIDAQANRYWFVEEPIPIEISGLTEKEYTSHPLLNPNNEQFGTRTVVLTTQKNKGTVFIAKMDTEEQKNKKGDDIRYSELKKGDIFRLKDLFTIQLEDVNVKNTPQPLIKAKFLTKEHDQEIRKIQWVPKNDFVVVKVLKPNGVIMQGYAESNIKDLKVGEVIQFERYGYVKIREIKPDFIYCYFAH